MRSIFGTTFGDTQIKQMCIVSFATLLATVSITSASVTERILVNGGYVYLGARYKADLLTCRRRAEDNKGLWTVLKTIFSTMLHLPTGIAAICRIWFFSCFGEHYGLTLGALAKIHNRLVPFHVLQYYLRC